MKQTELIMGMPITVEIVGATDAAAYADTFAFFEEVDARYSPYKPTSEISRINSGLPRHAWSAEMKHILQLAEHTKQHTAGYFDVTHDGRIDPSGIVKGWAIWEAAKRLQARSLRNFYIEAGGDIEACGTNAAGQPWIVGIRNPFQPQQIIKRVALSNRGIATSGTYIRGAHIYNPHQPTSPPSGIKSLTVIGPHVYEADRFATAAFAMGTEGIAFIERTKGLEGYMVDAAGVATLTSGFGAYVHG